MVDESLKHGVVTGQDVGSCPESLFTHACLVAIQHVSNDVQVVQVNYVFGVLIKLSDDVSNHSRSEDHFAVLSCSNRLEAVLDKL